MSGELECRRIIPAIAFRREAIRLQISKMWKFAFISAVYLNLTPKKGRIRLCLGTRRTPIQVSTAHSAYSISIQQQIFSQLTSHGIFKPSLQPKSHDLIQKPYCECWSFSHFGAKDSFTCARCLMSLVLWIKRGCISSSVSTRRPASCSFCLLQCSDESFPACCPAEMDSPHRHKNCLFRICVWFPLDNRSHLHGDNEQTACFFISRDYCLT